MFRTLIVEDNRVFRELLKEILCSRFPLMAMLEAGDGKEAFQKLHSLPPDLIFMDIKLPGENGLEITKKIKGQYPHAIVIILTNYDLPEYREAAIQCKADFFFSKGSESREEILKLVESIIIKKGEAKNG